VAVWLWDHDRSGLEVVETVTVRAISWQRSADGGRLLPYMPAD
jgi:hypothetical protein